MRRRLMIGGAWVASTGAAITLSWFGVDTVLKGTVYDPPRALPVSGTSAGAGPLPEPDASSTQRPPSRDPSPAPETPAPGDDGTTASAPPAAPSPGEIPDPPAEDAEDAGEPDAAAAGGLGTVETVRTEGGRVAFDLGESSADLVSATPEPGWDMQVWTEDTWIRVTFTAGGRELSVFCVWHDSPPRIERYEN